MSNPNPPRPDSLSASRPPSIQPLEFQELTGIAPFNALTPAERRSLPPQETNPFHQIKATLTVCVGRAEVTVGDLLNAQENQVIQLDQTVDEPVEILLHGQVIARGILVAVDDQFGVRITDLPVPLKP